MRYNYQNNMPKGVPSLTADVLPLMLGKTFVSVESYSLNNFPDKDVHDILVFATADGEEFIFSHDQCCCERVWIGDIAGDLNDLVGAPLLQAEEVTQRPDSSTTWTYYKFATVNGSVTVRWLGESNGYYSESVDIWHKPEVTP